jgi:predicted nucleic acid-binding Zn ribbon protein
VGCALCSTRCWYLYQVDQARNSRILFGLVQVVVVVVVVVVIVVGNAKQFN